MKPNSIVPTIEHEKTSLFLSLLKEMRPKQWTKNLLVFASAIFAGTFLDPAIFINTLIAFIAFSLMASSIYVINDIQDVEKDRQHPDKCQRPIASGAITITQASVLGAIVFLTSITLAAFVNYQLIIILLIYFFANLLYSFRLKHVVIIDVMFIALGFVLRAIAGAVAVNGELTSWFLLCTMSLSIFLALGKRRHELELFKDTPTNRRKVLEHYSSKLLDQLMAIATSLVIMFYSLYAATEDQRMMYTVPFVIYGIFRYYYLIYIKNSGGKPEELLISDWHILITVVLFGASVIFIKQFV
mgnify:CR=1 FL=1